MSHSKVFNQLKFLLAGGDTLSLQGVKNVLEKNKICLINGYGPTENTTFTCCFPMSQFSSQWKTTPIGKAISNTQVYILNNALNPVPISVPGELCIAGDGLSYGYINQSSLTADKFVPNPFSTTPGDRLYKTGDLARWLPDGNIEFIGRKDFQVKIRGFRIECGEIESVLNKHLAIKEALVLAKEHHKSEDKHLVAYFTSNNSTDLLSDTLIDELRNHLKQSLPDYMTPSFFVPLESFPLTPNGKVDCKALPDPDISAHQKEYAPPQTDIQKQLVKIWQDVLGIDKIGIHDNFFELGGHSLLASQLLLRIEKETGQAISLSNFFQNPTIRGVANIKEPISTELIQKTKPLKPFDKIPLSYTQLDFWFTYFESKNPWNLGGAWLISENLDISILSLAINKVVQNHQILWMKFSKWLPLQQLLPSSNFTVPFTDLRTKIKTEREKNISSILNKTTQTPIDLLKPPVCRFHLIRTEHKKFILCYCFSHLVIDGSGISILLKKLIHYYSKLRNNTSFNPEPTFQISDYIKWERYRFSKNNSLEQERKYWTTHLKGIKLFPVNVQHADINSGSFQSLIISEQLFENIQKVAQKNKCSFQIIILTILGKIISKLTKEKVFCITTISENRTGPVLSELIAPLMSEIIVKIDSIDTLNFEESVSKVSKSFNETILHDKCPWIIPLAILEKSKWPKFSKTIVFLIGYLISRAITFLFKKLMLYPNILQDYLAFLNPPNIMKFKPHAGINISINLNINPNIFHSSSKPIQDHELKVSAYQPKNMKENDVQQLPEWSNKFLNFVLSKNNINERVFIVHGPNFDNNFYKKIILDLEQHLKEISQFV